MTARPDTMLRRSTCFGAAALSLAVAVAWLLIPDRLEPTCVTAPARLDLAWHAGEQRGYRLLLDSDVVLDPASRAQRIRCALHAVLCMRVLDVAADSARVAFQLRDVSWRFGGATDAPRCAALGVPFVVHFAGGMPSRFRFPAGLDREIQDQLAEVVRTFQATAPAGPVSRWSALEEHGSGQYRAAYSVAGDGGWHKRKAGYLRGAAVRDAGTVCIEASVRVLGSAGSLQPAHHGSWWDRVEIRDELELSNDGNVVARVATAATLVALPGAFDATSDLARSTGTEQLLDRPVPVLERQQAEAPPPATRPASPEDLLRFRELIASFTADQGRDLAFVHRLAAMLQQFPQLAAELPPVLADAALHGSVAAGLAHALELAGNAECQDALGLVCGDSRYPEANRLRAIIALGGVANPAADSVQLLWLLRESRGDTAAQDLGNTALLALGRMGHTMAASDAARYAELASGLCRSLDDPDPDARAVALKALANTRDAALAPVAERHLDAPQPAVRAAAAQALAAMDGADSLGPMTDRLAREADGRVRTALVEGLRAMSHRSDQAFAACAAMLARERDPDACNALARYLVDNLQRYPQGREPLERLLQTGSQRGLVAYVAGRLHRAPRQ